MLKLIFIGILSAAFFSATFILNELMSSQGGHWFWSASLRYVFMWLILSIIIVIKSGVGTLVGLFRLFFEHYQFWCILRGLALMAGTLSCLPMYLSAKCHFHAQCHKYHATHPIHFTLGN